MPQPQVTGRKVLLPRRLGTRPSQLGGSSSPRRPRLGSLSSRRGKAGVRTRSGRKTKKREQRNTKRSRRLALVSRRGSSKCRCARAAGRISLVLPALTDFADAAVRAAVARASGAHSTAEWLFRPPVQSLSGCFGHSGGRGGGKKRRKKREEKKG